MEKIVHSYETIVVFSLKQGEEVATGLLEKVKAFIENGAKNVVLDDWGKRKLAYPINYELAGHYALFTFEDTGEFVAQLDRMYNITEGVLRSIIVKKD